MQHSPFILLLLLVATGSSSYAQNLYDAARGNDTAFIHAFISAGGNPDIPDAKGHTALILAAYNGNVETVQLLLEHKADANAADLSGNTALMGAAYKGFTPVVQLLLEHKADVNIRNPNGATALFFAATFGRQEIALLLLRHNANKHITDRFGKQAYDYAAGQENTEMMEILK